MESVYRGDSRLKAAKGSIELIYSMLQFQLNFFDNGAVPGLVLKTKDILSQKIWLSLYSWNILIDCSQEYYLLTQVIQYTPSTKIFHALKSLLFNTVKHSVT